MGREARNVDLSRVNVSSCGFIVTLHGATAHAEDRRAVERMVGKVPGVLGVESKLKVVSISKLR